MSNRILDPNEMIQVIASSADDRLGNSEPTVDPDQRWTIGHDLADASGAYALAVSDNCTSANAQHVAGTAGAAPDVYTVRSFGAVVTANRNIRCANGEEDEIVRALLDDGGVEAAAEWALWYGIPGWDPSLQPYINNLDVQTVPVSGTPQDTVAALVARRAQLTVSKGYLLHLGVKAALDLSATGSVFLDGPDPVQNALRIRGIDAPVIVSPYYPVSGIALTGPIVVRVSQPVAFQQWDYNTNKTFIEGFRILEIDMDPSTAVRAV